MRARDALQKTDPSGLDTLERFAAATHFNRWMFDTIQPWCKGHVLEVGSGIGNLSKLFLEKNIPITTSDLREEYCAVLREAFGHYTNLGGVELLDLAARDFTSRYEHLAGRFDTVIALNVVEHIEDAPAAVRHCHFMLKPGGHVVILVPAYQALFNSFDVELGHFVRYTAKTLGALLESQQLEVIHQQYFNAAGIAGWFMNGSLLHKKLIPRKQLQLFDKLLPLIKLADTLTFHRIGLSVIAVGQKPI